MNKKRILIIAGAALLALVSYLILFHKPARIVLTGIVTTDDVIVSSEIQGRLQDLLVKEGDKVKAGELLAVIKPEEWQADMSFYSSSEQQSQAQVAQAESDLRYQEEQTSNQIEQAGANLAAAESQVVQGQADRENARLTFERDAQGRGTALVLHDDRHEERWEKRTASASR